MQSESARTRCPLCRSKLAGSHCCYRGKPRSVCVLRVCVTLLSSRAHLGMSMQLVSKVTLKLKATEAQLLALLERQRRRVEDSRHRVKRSKGKRLRKQQRDTSASRRGGGAPTSKSARKTKTKRTTNSQRRERSQSHPETGSESDAQPAMAVGKERSLGTHLFYIALSMPCCACLCVL